MLVFSITNQKGNHFFILFGMFFRNIEKNAMPNQQP